jgi:O-antigen/teichoic acid export membrane protein
MATASHGIPELDPKGLRSFGLTTGGIVAVLFGLLLPWLLDRSLPLWPWVLFAVLALAALLFPAGLRPVYRAWMRFGLLMSRITTPLILGLAFFLVVTPIALIRHLFGKDSMARAFDRAAQSYRVASRKSTKDSLEKPY